MVRRAGTFDGAMSHDDLPPDWTTQPLDDPRLLAAAVDLFTLDADRRRGCLVVLLCDGETRLLQPLVVDDVPLDCSAQQQATTMDKLARVVQQVCPGGALALAVGRPGLAVPTLWEHGWRTALAAACRSHQLTALGCFLATPRGVVRLDGDEAEAA